MAQLTVFRQTEGVQVSLNIQNHGELSTTADLDDGRAGVVDPGCLGDHSCRCSNTALSRFVVTACIDETGVGEKERMVATASCINDVEAFQARHQRWLLVSLQFWLAQLGKIVAT